MVYNQNEVDAFRFEVVEPDLKALAYYRNKLKLLDIDTVPEEFRSTFEMFKDREISIEYERVRPYEHVILEKWMGSNNRVDRKILNRERYYNRVGVFNSLHEYYRDYLQREFCGSINYVECSKRWELMPLSLGMYFSLEARDFCMVNLEKVHVDYEFRTKDGIVKHVEQVEPLKIPLLDLRKDLNTQDAILSRDVATVNGNQHGYFKKLRKDAEYEMINLETGRIFKRKILDNIVPLSKVIDYISSERIAMMTKILMDLDTIQEAYEQLDELGGFEALMIALKNEGYVLEYNELALPELIDTKVEQLLNTVKDQSFVYDVYTERGKLVDSHFKLDFSDSKHFGGR